MRYIHTLRLLFCLPAVIIACNVKLAFCECDYDWAPGQRILGANDIVRAFTSWDPDGDGPQPELLVAGGSFTAIGSVRANQIAAWNGESWAQLGNGLDGIVRALATYNGELIAAGDFLNADGLTVNRIARWDGAQWHEMDGGTDARVYALSVFDGKLVACGDFTMAGEEPANHIARWDGNTWTQFGDGIEWNVHALIEFNGMLHAGGAGVRRWDGFNWTLLGSQHQVNALAVFNGDLFSGGETDLASGNQDSYVGRWTGASWVPVLGQGLAPNDDVYALTVFGNELYAGGYFDLQNTKRIRRWNGEGWSPVHVGVNNTVYALTTFQDQLVAGGQFYRCGFVEAHRIASWDGVVWRPIDAHPDELLAISINSFVEWNGQVFGAGQFVRPGGDREYYVARRQGDHWEPLGSFADDGISDIVVYNDTLVACGSFLEIDGVGVGRVAQWDETHGWQPLGAGMNNPVSTVSVIGSDLYAGGHFTEADSWIANRLARWDGKGWLPVDNVGMNGQVSAILEFEGSLVVGGTFTNAGGTLAVGIARRTGGQWQAFGNSFAVGELGIVIVRALAQYDGKLIAAGDFSISGTKDVAQWTGTQWLPMDFGFTGISQAYALSLAVFDGNLYAGGGLTSANGLPLNYVARWNGAAWLDLNGGMTTSIGTPIVNSLHASEDSLLVGGSFYLAGDQVSTAMAEWQRVATVGDFDVDCDVDLNDYQQFFPCLQGPDFAPSNKCSELNTDESDFIDMLDVAAIQNNFTGADS